MCDPFTIALLVGGTLASVAGNQISSNEASEQAAAIAKARNDELNRTLARNKEFSDRSREIFDKRVGDISTNAGADIAKTQETHQGNIQANIPEAAPANVSLAGSAPTVVKSALGQKMAEVFGESTDKAKRTGALTGFGGFFQDQSIQDQAAGRDVGVNADMIAGNMRLLPMLQDFRQLEATKASSGLGQILQAVGGMASSAAGARGMGGGGMSPATAASLGKAQTGFYNPGVGPGGMGFLRPGGPR